MRLFEAAYAKLIDEFASGKLVAWGAMHEDAPSLPIPTKVWSSDSTLIDWAANEILPQPDQRIRVDHIEAAPTKSTIKNGRPPKYSWGAAFTEAVSEMEAGWVPENGGQFARKVMEHLEKIDGTAPSEEKQVIAYLKKNHPEHWESVKQKPGS